MTVQHEPGSQPADPLAAAASVLQSIDSAPLAQHPSLFGRFDELLREALDAPAPVSPD
jgi:hypothetical protein